MLLIRENSPTWNEMWEWVAKHPMNEDIFEPSVAFNELNDECWEYIGTFKSQLGSFVDGRVVSEFRHRSHPKDNDVKYLKFGHTVPEEDIEKVLAIK